MQLFHTDVQRDLSAEERLDTRMSVSTSILVFGARDRTHSPRGRYIVMLGLREGGVVVVV